MMNNSVLYRAVCDMHTAQQLLIDYLMSLSKKYFMQDIPVRDIQHILTLSSRVIIACDNYNAFYRCSKYGGIIVDTNGILKYRN